MKRNSNIRRNIVPVLLALVLISCMAAGVFYIRSYMMQQTVEERSSQLEDMIDQYGSACVSDLYDACGQTTSNYQLNKFGWTSLATASVVRVRDGYMLKLPKATAL